MRHSRDTRPAATVKPLCAASLSGRATIVRRTPVRPARAPAGRSSRLGSPAPAGRAMMADPEADRDPGTNSPRLPRTSTSLPGQLRPAIDQTGRGLRVNGSGRAVHQGGKRAGRSSRGPPPRWPGRSTGPVPAPGEHGAQALGTGLGPGNSQLTGVDPWQAKILRAPDQLSDGSRLDHAHTCVGPSSVTSSRPSPPVTTTARWMDSVRARTSAISTRLLLTRHANELMRGAGRVAKRPHQVEDRPERQFPPDSRHPA